MRFVLGILIPLTAALLQGTVAPLIAVGGARPLLPILVAASWSIAAGAREGVWWAFLGGLASVGIVTAAYGLTPYLAVSRDAWAVAAAHPRTDSLAGRL